jgi:hypothetical protein
VIHLAIAPPCMRRPMPDRHGEVVAGSSAQIQAY